MGHTLCTFNVNNLYVRYRFGEKFPGDRSQQASHVAPEGWGFLPLNTEGTVKIFNAEQREMAALAIRRGKERSNKLEKPKKPLKPVKPENYPDILCLQEVESLIALREFNRVHLEGVYPYAVLLDGRDLRHIDVAVLSKLPITSVRTHIDDPDPKEKGKAAYIFSRDCLEVDIQLTKAGKTLTLFVNHLKSKFAETDADRKSGDAKRERQADEVKKIVNARFPDLGKGLYAIVGDLNDEPRSKPLAPLMKNTPFVNAVERIVDENERWTHWYRGENQVSQMDFLLLSPELDKATKNEMPVIERRGIGFDRVLANKKGTGPKLTKLHKIDDDPNPVEIDFQFSRFTGVTPSVYASDHCPIFLEIP